MITAKKLTYIALIVFLVTIFSFFTQKKSEAGPMNVFGGRVTMKTACTCSTGYQVTIQGSGQSSGTYLEYPGTRIYSRNFISPGRNILGTYNPGGQCLVTGTPCVTLPITKGTINIAGVSF